MTTGLLDNAVAEALRNLDSKRLACKAAFARRDTANRVGSMADYMNADKLYRDAFEATQDAAQELIEALGGTE